MRDIFVTDALMFERGKDLIQPLLYKFGVKEHHSMQSYRGKVFELIKPLPKHIGILELPPQVHKELRIIRSGFGVSPHTTGHSYKATARCGFGLTDPRGLYGSIA